MMKTALGMDIGGTKIRGAIVSEDGSLLDIKEIPTEARFGGEHVLTQLKALIDQLMHKEICGIGIGTAGQVNLNGEILSATDTFPNWSGIALQKRLEIGYQLPVRVVNDVQAMALGELHFGEGKMVKDFICLALGTGVGGAVVAEGKLIRGSNGAAGEIGHMTIREGGRKCPCGKKGCLEAYASGSALLDLYKERTSVSKTGPEIFNSALNGELNAHTIINEYISNLVTGIASLAAIFNPTKVILGGGVADALDVYLAGINTEVKQKVSDAAGLNLTIVKSKINGGIIPLGAASLVF
jgi:glucokinase